MDLFSISDLIQLVLYFGLLFGFASILGNYISKVFTGTNHFMLPVLGWLERITYKLTGTNPIEETNWKSYATNLLLFN